MNASVLIIDDDAALNTTLQLLLDDWGLEAETARSGEEGLERLKRRAFDVIVSDVQMPGLSGTDVLRIVREQMPAIPVILLTGHGSVKQAVEAMRNGAFDYVLKPIDEEEFEVVVRRALDLARLQRENKFLRAEAASMGPDGSTLLGRSPRMLEIFDLVNRIARATSTVLITGETGTGKELVARTIHYKSPRADRPFVPVNCAALNANLLESELFGHEKGAFTGAIAARRGRFEEADGGTLFLDEIGETSREFQAKLLRVLQEGEFERVGGNRRIRVDVRFMAATNRDIEKEVREERFREDLYYRLRVTPIHIPPLRERPEDILPIASHFLAAFVRQYGSPARRFTPDAERYLLSQPWEGNVRELQHAVERAVILARHEAIEPLDLKIVTGAGGRAPDERATLEDQIDRTTREYVLRILEQTNWQKQKAAEILGIDRATLYRILKKHSLLSAEDERGS